MRFRRSQALKRALRRRISRRPYGRRGTKAAVDARTLSAIVVGAERVTGMITNAQNALDRLSLRVSANREIGRMAMTAADRLEDAFNAVDDMGATAEALLHDLEDAGGVY